MSLLRGAGGVQAEGTGDEKIREGTTCISTGLEPAEYFFDYKNWSLGQENDIPGLFLPHSEGNVHRRDVGGIAKERLNHKATNAR